MRLILLLALLVGALPAAGWTQSVQLSGHTGIAVAEPDTTPGAHLECVKDTQPVVVTLNVSAEGRFSVKPSRLFDNRAMGVVRERKGTTLRLAPVADASRGQRGVQRPLAFEGSGRLQLCWSNAGMTYRRGQIAIIGGGHDYKIGLDETLEALTDAFDAGLTLSYQTELLRVGAKPRWSANWHASFWGRPKGSEGMDLLGGLRLSSSNFNWRFEPLWGSAPPVSHALNFDFSFIVLDGGLRPM